MFCAREHGEFPFRYTSPSQSWYKGSVLAKTFPFSSWLELLCYFQYWVAIKIVPLPLPPSPIFNSSNLVLALTKFSCFLMIVLKIYYPLSFWLSLVLLFYLITVLIHAFSLAISNVKSLQALKFWKSRVFF